MNTAAGWVPSRFLRGVRVLPYRGIRVLPYRGVRVLPCRSTAGLVWHALFLNNISTGGRRQVIIEGVTCLGCKPALTLACVPMLQSLADLEGRTANID